MRCSGLIVIWDMQTQLHRAGRDGEFVQVRLLPFPAESPDPAILQSSHSAADQRVLRMPDLSRIDQDLIRNRVQQSDTKQRGRVSLSQLDRESRMGLAVNSRRTRTNLRGARQGLPTHFLRQLRSSTTPPKCSRCNGNLLDASQIFGVRTARAK